MLRSQVARIGEALRPGDQPSWLTILVVLGGSVPAVWLATQFGLLIVALGMIVAAIVTAIGFRWPLLPLAIFVVFIPIEEMLVIEGLGTFSRLAGILFAVTYGATRMTRLAFGAMPPAAWAFLAWALLSTGWAIDANVARGQLFTLAQLFLIAFLVADYVVQHPSMVRPILWMYSLAAAATAPLAIAVFVGLGSGGSGRAAALTDQSPAQFAAILLPAVSFGVFEVVSGNRRILGGAVALITTLAIVVSGTRGAWVAVAVVFLLVVMREPRIQRRIAAVATVLVLMVVVYQFPGVADLLAERTGTAVSSGGAGRTDIWTVGATIYGSEPVLGVGYANFSVAYTPEAVREANVDYGLTGAGPHNIVIGTLAELGPIGLALLATFLLPLASRRGWGPDAGAVQASLAALLTMAVFLDIFGNRKQVWLVIGIAAGLAYLAKLRDRNTTNGSSPENAPRSGVPQI